jgi:hypothetical protein
LLTRTQLASTAWRRLFRGVYADASLPETHGVAMAGAALIIPASGVFGGRSAAYLLGAETLAEPTTPVDVIVPEADRFGRWPGSGYVGLRCRTQPSAACAATGARRPCGPLWTSRASNNRLSASSRWMCS